MDKLSICFVENDRRSISAVLDTLQRSRKFQIHHYATYDAIGAAEIDEVQLFILDVDIGGTDEVCR